VPETTLPETTVPETTALDFDVRDGRLTPTAARAVARAVILQERARAAAQRRRRGFGVRPPTSMPHSGLLRRRAPRAA
jgi:hypothetical protein